jgi:hypothetical protein
MLFALGYSGAKTIDEADFVLFTGGEDVSPDLYGEIKLNKTFSNPIRDQREALIYHHCVETGIPMAGICRGGQFLNVMNKGTLWQDIDGHAIGGSHLMEEILPKGMKRKPRLIPVTSTHHQQMIPGKDVVVVGIGVMSDGKPISTLKISAGREISGKSKSMPDYEVLLYPKTRSLCFQPHPEFDSAPKECTDFFDECLDNYILPFSK